ncbi:MAG: ABC transporter ATP-binding protein [Pseudomonadota bacterium]
MNPINDTVVGPSSLPILDVRDVQTSYGSIQALFGIDIQIYPGECITLLGRNGMGKSTTVKSIMGMQSCKSGVIKFFGEDISAMKSYKVAQAGIGLVPEGRRIFPNLSVRENLVATAHAGSSTGPKWKLDEIYSLFPRLREREKNLGCNLSGGEQQMLAIGRALMTNPRLLILDEATEGLAPLVREEIWACLLKIKSLGIALIVIDKNLRPLLKLADRHYVFEKGRVVWSGNSTELKASPELVEKYIGM